MTVIAIARVGYEENEGDVDSIVWFEPGDEIKGAPDEIVEQWKASGSVGDPPEALPSVVEEKKALEARVADLEAQLEAAKKSAADESASAAKPAASSTSTPAKSTPTKSTP